ncbi:MAG: alpha/beta hydrolase [Actinomycetota bacterium]|nr:alpha/beta fold hydrolase [Actinomycetota bacterium]
MPQIVKGAEPWAHQGDDTGVLVVHGFSGSPQSVRYWAEGIAAQGFTVTVPRLPGHGTDVADMHGATAAAWIGEAEMHLTGLFERCRNIFICGLSMGGTITLELAERFSDRLSGIVIVNTPVLLSDARERLAPILGRIPLALKGVANDVADPTQRELAYEKVSTKAAGQFITMRERVRAHLADVRCPLLQFKSRQDHVVKLANAEYIQQHVSSSDKELVWLDKSYHVATIDYDRDLIVDRTNRFMKEHIT